MMAKGKTQILSFASSKSKKDGLKYFKIITFIFICFFLVQKVYGRYRTLLLVHQNFKIMETMMLQQKNL